MACGYCFYGLVAVDLAEAALSAVVLYDGGGLGLEGLHAFDEDGFRVVGRWMRVEPSTSQMPGTPGGLL